MKIIKNVIFGSYCVPYVILKSTIWGKCHIFNCNYCQRKVIYLPFVFDVIVLSSSVSMATERRNFHQKLHFFKRVADLCPPPTPHRPTPPPTHPPPTSPWCSFMLLMLVYICTSSHLHIICINLQINGNDKTNQKAVGIRGLIWLTNGIDFSYLRANSSMNLLKTTDWPRISSTKPFGCVLWRKLKSLLTL